MKYKTGLLIDDCYLKHAINGHSIENPERIRALSGIVRNRYKKTCTNPYSYDRDTYLMKDSLVTAEFAAGGCLSLADRTMADDILQGFAVVRPPGF